MLRKWVVYMPKVQGVEQICTVKMSQLGLIG